MEMRIVLEWQGQKSRCSRQGHTTWVHVLISSLQCRPGAPLTLFPWTENLIPAAAGMSQPSSSPGTIPQWPKLHLSPVDKGSEAWPSFQFSSEGPHHLQKFPFVCSQLYPNPASLTPGQMFVHRTRPTLESISWSLDHCPCNLLL